MRFHKIILLIPLISTIACNQPGSDDEEKNKDQGMDKPVTSQKSLPSQATKKINDARLTINYTAPAVRGREIWGALVPYDKVWVTGAHNATSLEVSKEISIGNTRIPAGKYAIFTIPSREEWTVIINKNWEQHLADEYSQEDDLVRIKVMPITLKEPVERLAYEIDQTGERHANILIRWERLEVRFPIQILN